jgi:DNA-binding protein HU-beta
MNKAQLVAAIATAANISVSQAEITLATTLESITTSLTAGYTVTLTGFGRFGVKKRSARKVRNPKTGNEIMLNATLVPFFKVGKHLKDTVAGKETTK